MGPTIQAFEAVAPVVVLLAGLWLILWLLDRF